MSLIDEKLPETVCRQLQKRQHHVERVSYKCDDLTTPSVNRISVKRWLRLCPCLACINVHKIVTGAYPTTGEICRFNFPKKTLNHTVAE